MAKSHNIGRDLRIDINRVAAAAIDAALSDESATRERTRRHRVPGGRLILTGAALAAAARAGQKHMPALTKLRLAKNGLAKLNDLPNLRDVGGTVRDRFAGFTHRDDDDVGEGGYDEDSLGEDVFDEGEDDDEDEDEEDWGEDEGDDEGDDGSLDEESGGNELRAEDDQRRRPRDANPSQLDTGAEDEDEDRNEDEDEDRDRDEDRDADQRPAAEDEAEPPRLRNDTPDLVGSFGRRRLGARTVEFASRLDPAARPPEPVQRGSSGPGSSTPRGSGSRRSGSGAARK